MACPQTPFFLPRWFGCFEPLRFQVYPKTRPDRALLADRGCWTCCRVLRLSCQRLRRLCLNRPCGHCGCCGRWRAFRIRCGWACCDCPTWRRHVHLWSSWCWPVAPCARRGDGLWLHRHRHRTGRPARRRSRPWSWHAPVLWIPTVLPEPVPAHVAAAAGAAAPW